MENQLKFNLKKIAKKFDLDLLVLFGSRVKGNFKKDSDWDFAFFSSKKIDYFKLYLDIENLITTEIDLVDLNNSDDILLKKEIFQNSEIIFESKVNLFDSLQLDINYMYLDYGWFFKLEKEFLKEQVNML